MNPQSPQSLFPEPKLPAKRRTARIARDYLKSSSTWDNYKRRGTWILVIGAGIVGLYTFFNRSGAQAFSRGPVISAHAATENSCEKCHQDFAPITGEAAGFRLPEWSHKTLDSKCKDCHKDMPQHNRRSLYDPVEKIAEANCASCHQDHQGRGFDLRHVADRHCTVCHENLKQHDNKLDASDSERLTAKILSFNDGSHPNFRSIVDLKTNQPKQDPGKLKFNHAMHMSAGIPQTLTNLPVTDPNYIDPSARGPFTNIQLEEYGRALGKSFEKLYATNAQNQIQMNCTDCHEHNRTEVKFANAGLAVGENSSTAGDYYMPVIYERHCAACHTLPYQTGGYFQPEHFVPHQATGKQLQEFVERKIYRSTIQQDPALDQQIKQRPPVMPGNRVSGIIPETLEKQVETAVQKSGEFLTTKTCSKCHAEITTTAANPFPQVPATGVPRQWYEHANFNHHAHRDVAKCSDCHKQAYPDVENASLKSETLMIPQITNCQNCHTPEIKTDPQGKTSGGAGHHCTECHSYHNHSPRSSPLTSAESALQKLLGTSNQHQSPKD